MIPQSHPEGLYLATQRTREPEGTEPQGAYGLRFDGLTDGNRLLRPVGAHAPALRVEQGPANGALLHDSLTDDTAELRLHNGSVAIDRRTMVATFRLGHVPTDEEIVHPLLAGTAAVVSRWLGRETFHAGAFTTGKGAWALIGDKGSGKSSTLAWLSLLGLGMVTDDLLVVERGFVLPGPSCVDLRADASTRLGIGDGLGVVGSRERWRALTPASPDGVPLQGWVFLAWGDRVEVRPVPPAKRLIRLLEHVGVRAPPPEPVAYLDFAALPCWELRRPRRWSSLRAAADALLGTLAGTAAITWPEEAHR